MLELNGVKGYVVSSGDVIFEPANTKRKSLLPMLVCMPSPRDIPDFIDSVDSSLQGYDKVWFKYFRQHQNPYSHIRKYFMTRRQYSHLALLPDDLIIHKKGVDRLVELTKRYHVVMGTCSVEYGSKEMAMTANLPALKRSERVYRWIKSNSPMLDGVITVPYCGTPFAILSRDVVRKVSLATDLKWNSEDNVGSAEDVVLANELARLGIPIHVDTSVYFIHYKNKDKNKLSPTI